MKKNDDFFFLTDSDKNKNYTLEMLYYPSGRLHVGHLRLFTIGDAVARANRIKGLNVLHPMGADAFGLPAENAAIQNGTHPKNWTYQNIETMNNEIKKVEISYDWSKTLNTCDPEYIKHEQKIFIDFFKKDLAYQKESMINWDPVDQTVLSNEQVVNGKGWRSGAVVEKRTMKQWFFKITSYAEELLQDLKTLDWTEKIKKMQEKWIGKSEGVEIDFEILQNNLISDERISVFTTRADTIYGVTSIAISFDHPIALKLEKIDQKVANFLKECRSGGVAEEEIATRKKKGIYAGLSIKNPISNEIIPVLIANYVLMNYGTGAVMVVPAHDERDFECIKECFPEIQLKSISKREKVNVITEFDNFYLKQFQESDLDDLYKFVQESDAFEFYIGEDLLDKKKWMNSIQRWNKNFKELGFSRLAICDKNTDEIIGVAGCGLIHDPDKNRNLLSKITNKWDQFIDQNLSYDVEIGYRLHKKLWGKGIGTKVVSAVCKWVFETNKDLNRIIAYINEENIASKKLFEKIGGQLIGEINTQVYRNELQYCLYRDFFINLSNILNPTKNEIIDQIEKLKCGKKKITYKLRDWCVSRQRYWGCPIPIIYCDSCGTLHEREENLPILLPDDVIFDGKGNPLENHPTWKNCKCPKCGKDAIRETDTLDTYVESSWYFLRYINPKLQNKPFDLKELAYTMPVDLYLGGPEHATTHMLYARFFMKSMRDCGYFTDFQGDKTCEPFKKFIATGMVCHKTYQTEDEKYLYPSEVVEKNGNYFANQTNQNVIIGSAIKMSKSKKNTVEPSDVIEKYGCDVVRFFMLSDNPIDNDFDWNDKGLSACYDYINKVKNFFLNINTKEFSVQTEKKALNDLRKLMNAYIDNFDAMKFNISNAKFREFISYLLSNYNLINKKDIMEVLRDVLMLIKPIMPKFSAELIDELKLDDKNFQWQKFFIEELNEDVNFVVQINGKTKKAIEIEKDLNEEEVKKIIKNNEYFSRHLIDKEIKKTIFIKNKLINFTI